MREPIFNLYYIINDGIIRGRAAMRYIRKGTDDEKLEYLQSVCATDAPRAKRYPVPSGWLYIDNVTLYRHEQTTLDYSADLCRDIARIAPPDSAVAKQAGEAAAALALLTAALVAAEVPV